MSDNCSASHPSEIIELNGHSYILEATLRMWGTVEVMTRNPAVAELVSNLERRLEKAEAGLDAGIKYFVDEAEKHDLAVINSDGRESVAADIAKINTYLRYAAMLRALKSPPPTPDQG